ncbi:hypothetical protein [Aquimarina celericrescens]|uniref:VRR-NUC domain-containing protein n=1 Tax=Aquimarina celericrescens TaxID=1964542 RepID=A0ABW5ATL9_9FLAO|nr:hypothetical protein [Aquimarina celericrescens]
MNNQGLKKLAELALKDIENRYPNFPKHAIPQPKYIDNTSNGLTRCVIDWIELNGFQAERINSMGRQIDKRKTVTDVLGNKRTVGSVTWTKGSSQKGTADISATIKGRSVKIEIKCEATGDHYQSEDQKRYQKSIERAGGIYIIVRTFEDFYVWLNKFID